MAELHKIDPDGDLIMQLFRKPKEDSDTSIDQISESSDGDETRDIVQTQSSPDEETENKTESESDTQTTLAAGVAKLQVVDESEEVQFLVSSRHMILASRVFKSMLDKNKFHEGRTLHAEGGITIPFPDDDPDAFIVLLNIVHGFTRAVDRAPSLGRLTEIAILVDKYEFHETVEVFAGIWMSNLTDNEDIPCDYSDSADVMRWLAISWIFKDNAVFKVMTQIVQRECSERLDDDIDERLPIPESVINDIKGARNDAIELAVACIYGLISQRMKTQKTTGISDKEARKSRNSWLFAHDALILGSLIKNAAECGIWPRVEKPYRGISFDKLSRKLRIMKIYDHCDKGGSDAEVSINKEAKTQIKEELTMIQNLYLDGLKLSDFTKVP